MLLRIAGAQDKIDSQNQQYVEGEGYVIYKSYPVGMDPMREGSVGNEELMPRKYEGEDDNITDSYYNYTNKRLNPEYNRGAEEKQDNSEEKVKYRAVSFCYEGPGNNQFSRGNYKAFDNARESVTVGEDIVTDRGVSEPSIEPYIRHYSPLSNPDNYKTQRNARESTTVTKDFNSWKGIIIQDYPS